MKSRGKGEQRTPSRSNIRRSDKNFQENKGTNRTAGSVRSANRTLGTIIQHETHTPMFETRRPSDNAAKHSNAISVITSVGRRIKIAGNSMGRSAVLASIQEMQRHAGKLISHSRRFPYPWGSVEWKWTSQVEQEWRVGCRVDWDSLILCECW